MYLSIVIMYQTRFPSIRKWTFDSMYVVNMIILQSNDNREDGLFIATVIYFIMIVKTKHDSAKKINRNCDGTLNRESNLCSFPYLILFSRNYFESMSFVENSVFAIYISVYLFV